jgi:hypothetical protein
MRLYRGIAVPERAARQCIADICSNGLPVVRGRWQLLFHDLKPRLDDLRAQDTITLSDTRATEDPPDWICACAQQAGALYYACHHNRSKDHNTPLLITFEAKDIIVDGRDFLYTLFQLGEPSVARPAAIQIFGPGISRYLDRAWASDDQGQRVSLCDLAIQDESVIVAHGSNQTVIGGQHGTVFQNAFMVRAPVAARSIDDVRIVDELVPIPSIDVGLQAVLRQ